MDDLARYVGNQDEFPVLREWDFFNHAGVSPMPRAAADAMRKHAAESESKAYLFTSWYSDIEKLRVLAGSIINAHRDEIALFKNTTEGISTVANRFEWPIRHRLVTTG